jgi:hypothetical protein
MIGLMYLLALAIWIAVIWLFTWSGWKLGRGAGKSAYVAGALAVVGFVLACLPVFGQAIPTHYIHKQNCAKDAGFKEFVPASVWIEQHKDVIEQLREGASKTDKLEKVESLSDTKKRYKLLSGALYVVYDYQQISRHVGISHYRTETHVYESKDNKLLASAVDYGTNEREDVRIWLSNTSCFSESDSPLRKMDSYKYQFMGVKK